MTTHLFNILNQSPGLGQMAIGSGTINSISLNAAATLGSSGPMVGFRFFAMSTDPINEAYIFLESVGGTIGNITMRCRVVNESGVLNCGTTVRATASTVTIPAAGGMWIKAVFATPYTPTIGEMLWIVWDNTSASPTVDYPNIRYASAATNWVRNSALAQSPLYYATSTNGFSSGSGRIGGPHFFVQGSQAYGFPWTDHSNTPWTGLTDEARGILTSVLEVDTPISWWLGGSSGSAATGLDIYLASEPPGGSALHSWNLGTDANQVTDEVVSAKRFSEALLSAGSAYRLVFREFSTSAGSPRGYIIEDYSSHSAVIDTIYNGINICKATYDNGAGGWTDTGAILPFMFFGSDRYVAAGGGGTVNLLRGKVG